jgi:hypothetical protein
MRRPRFRLRTLLIAVTVVAVIVWGAEMFRRRERALGSARNYGYAESHYRSILARCDEILASRSQYPEDWGARYTNLATQVRPLAWHAAQMRRKHERAALFPWLSVTPDPPLPEP